MVLTKQELIGLLQNEARILLHLTTKIDRSMIDYRPTAKQRSTIELLRYLSIMGPSLLKFIKAGSFDQAAWQESCNRVSTLDFDQVLAELQKQFTTYPELVGAYSDEDFRGEIEMFGQKMSRGVFIVNLVLGGCAAYRTQLFCYLKSCGRDELNTMNLWGGADAAAA
jgi:hypothetical protein